MNGRFHCAFTHPQLGAYLTVSNFAFLPCQIWLYTVEELRSTVIGEFFFEAFESKIDQRQRPTAFKEFLRGQEVRSIREVIALGAVHFQRNDGHSAAAFLRLLAIPFVRQEMIQRSQQKRSKLAP